MFESVAPEKFTKRSRKAFYEALPVSVGVHAVIGAAVLAAHVATVIFPDQAPAQMMSFALAEFPPRPPPPPPLPKPPLARQAPAQAIDMPNEIVAPTVIPEEIPMIVPTSVVAEMFGASPAGVEGGIPGGEIGGVLGGTPGGVVTEPDRVVVERDRPLPMYPLSQVYPVYPEEARLRTWEDQLVVRYLVGKDGRVKRVTVVSPPERTIFVGATVKAIRNWRFRPLIKDGERQEVEHELTVFYKLNQES